MLLLQVCHKTILVNMNWKTNRLCKRVYTFLRLITRTGDSNTASNRLLTRDMDVLSFSPSLSLAILYFGKVESSSCSASFCKMGHSPK